LVSLVCIFFAETREGYRQEAKRRGSELLAVGGVVRLGCPDSLTLSV
jgi:hypothetical protein